MACHNRGTAAAERRDGLGHRLHEGFDRLDPVYRSGRPVLHGISGGLYAGYATTALNPEPYAYESGFAMKWLINSKIRGDSLNYDSNRGPFEAPWLSWACTCGRTG